MASHDHSALDLMALLASISDIQGSGGRLRRELDALRQLASQPLAPGGTCQPVDTKMSSRIGTSPLVSVAEIDTPPRLAPSDETDPETPTFHLFPRLPAELRLRIWALSFAPRIVELHTRRTHYADFDRHGSGHTRWLSLSRNPAALSVNAEARAAALEHYTVALPLAAPLVGNQTLERPGDLLGDGDRVLYINLEGDTVVVLGDPPFERLTRLLEWFRQRDEESRPPSARRRRAESGGPGGARGLERLALSAAPWVHAAGSGTLRVFARTVFADLEEFSMFMYAERVPPSNWRGGKVLLDECGASDHYRRFLMGRGMQFREGEKWMKVGRNRLRVLDIGFDQGW